MTAREVYDILNTYRFNYANEQELQQGIRCAFISEQLNFGEEVSLTKQDRIDFMVERVGIEVKVGHPLAAWDSTRCGLPRSSTGGCDKPQG